MGNQFKNLNQNQMMNLVPPATGISMPPGFQPQSLLGSMAPADSTASSTSGTN